MSDCYFDGAGCLVCPEEPARAYVPARIDHRAVVGWDAGGNTITVVDGNLHAVLPAGTVPTGLAGAVIGLKSERSRQTVPDLIEHGWFFQSLAGHDMAQVVERGSQKTAPAVRASTDVFELRRQKGQVTYWKNNTLVYTSMAQSSGVKLLNCCLYASGDAIGSSDG